MCVLCSKFGIDLVEFWHADAAGGASGPVAAAGEGKPSFDAGEAAHQLFYYIKRYIPGSPDYINNGNWIEGYGSPLSMTYGFRAYAPTGDESGLFADRYLDSQIAPFQRMNAKQIEITELALQLWSEAANIELTRAGSEEIGGIQYADFGEADYLFSNYTNNYRGGFGNFSFWDFGGGDVERYSQVWINSNGPYWQSPSINNYSLVLILHEVAHGFGLFHPGNYNTADVTYASAAEYVEDSRQYTVMSYFSEKNTGANFGGLFPMTPMLHDIFAIQMLYGANMDTRADDTIYGFNSNTGSQIYGMTKAADKRVYSIWDGGGEDTLDFSLYGGTNTIDLREGAFSSVGGLKYNVSIAFGAVIENAIGGKGADTITGNDENNKLYGLDGNDILFGLGGDDMIEGGKGNDVIEGGDGNDEIFGLAGNDTLIGGKGDDKLDGGDGNDILIGGEGDDELTGGAGKDRFDYEGQGADVITDFEAGAAKTDVIRIANTYQTFAELMAEATEIGADTVFDFGGGNTLTVQGVLMADFHENDFVFNKAPTITSNGGAATAAINVAENATKVTTVKATDPDKDKLTYSIAGGADAAFFDIDATKGTLTFKAGPDFEDPQDAGNDNTYEVIVRASDGGYEDTQTITVTVTNLTKETITGTDNDDTFFATTDQEAFKGLGGTDTVSYENSGIGVDVNLGGKTKDAGFAKGDSFNSIENLVGSDFGDTLTGDKFANRIEGGDGDDVIDGGLGDDELDGGLGTDTVSFASLKSGVTLTLVNGDGTASYLNGKTPEQDTLTGFENVIGTAKDDAITGDDGDNVIEGGAGSDTLDGGLGNDTVSYAGTSGAVTVDLNKQGTQQDTKGAGKDTLSNFENILGGKGADTLTGDADANRLDGGAGNDTLTGGAGADELIGGDGNDILIGGEGDDTLTGGAGNDRFDYDGQGADVIKDFAAGAAKTDVIRIANTFSDFAALMAATTDAGSDAVIDFGGGNTLTVEGVNKADFDANDFLFNRAPVITSNSGGATAAINVAENATKVTTVKATDPDKDKLTYSIVGGADAAFFDIDATKGTLTFKAGPDFEDPQDAGNDNTYEVIVRASDGGLDDDQIITVTVTNLTKETITGTVNDDIFLATTDQEAFKGLGGTDTVSYENSGIGVDVNLGGKTKDAGFAKGDSFNSIENLVGSDFGDTLTGDKFANKIEGGDGDDVIDGGLGEDDLDGGDGVDTASFASLSVAVTASLATGIATYKNGKLDETDTLANFENLTGGKGADVLTGDANDNVIDGGAGNDTLIGGEGADHLIGGAGVDIISYAASDAGVTVTLGDQPGVGGHAQGDTWSGVEGVIGSDFADNLTGDAGANTLIGGDGNDVLKGLDGVDILIGGDGDDTLTGGLHGDRLVGGDGIDTIDYSESSAGVVVNLTKQGTFNPLTNVVTGASAQSGGAAAGDILSGIENVIGSAFNDTLTGDGNVNKLEGGDGNDILNGGAGADVLDGGDGTDTASYATAAAGVVASLADNNDNTGDADGDTYISIENLTGSTKDDALIGDAGANTLDGGAGNDVLIGGAGADQLIGGANAAGGDTADYSTSAAGVSVNLSQQGTKFDAKTGLITGGQAQTGGDAAGDLLFGIENVTGSDFDDTLTGDAKNNVIFGGDGNDVIDGGKGNDTLAGGDGIDTLSYASITSAVKVDLNITTAQNTGGGGTDTISGFENVIGTNANDTIKGDAGDNIITGGKGNDVLEGGAGADIYVYNVGDGHDTINGFEAGVDRIDISNFDGLEFGDLTIEQSGANTLIKLFGSNVVLMTLTNVDAGDIGAGEFIFGNAAPTITSDGGGTSASISFDENSNAAVTTVVATDIDGPDPIKYSISGGADAALFAIDEDTGELTFLSAPDAETPQDAGGDNTYEVTVKATDGIGSDTQTITVSINDEDEFDATEPTDADGAANVVDENAANGTAVGITAFSEDADATDDITYTLTDDAGGAFAIDASTGVVTVADGSKIDRETNSSLDITVKATSTDGSFEEKTFTIAVNDVSEFAATEPADTDGAADAVDENAANGTAVGITAFSEDADATTNTITYSLSDSAGGAFEIDANTGVVTVADGSKIDRESDASLDITVKATSADGSFEEKTFTIAVNDVDEFDVTAPVDSDNTANEVDENAVAGTLVGVTALSTDADATTNAVTYSLTDNAGGAFQIDAGTGVVTVLDGSKIDFEADISLDIVVKATSADGSFAEETFTINVNDRDLGITSNGGGATATIQLAENIAAVTTVTSGDTGVFSIDGGADAALFDIDANTGVLTFKSAPDFEAPADAGLDNTYEVVVKVFDGVNSDTQTITVEVTDENEAAPVITSNGGGATASVDIDENTAAVTTVVATDADAGDDITYSIDGGADAALFDIDANTGVLMFKSAPDAENPQDAGGDNSYEVIVKASDGDKSDTQTITVTVNDVNEFTPAITSNGGGATAAVNVAENGTAVTTVQAADADATANVTYSIDGGADAALFDIDANTGELTFKDAPDFEAPGDAGVDNTYEVVVKASDGASSDTQTISVTVTDADEPVEITSGTSFSIAENTKAVTTITAVDPDANATISYSLSGGADAALFDIDENTGELSFIDAPDFESGGDNSYEVVVKATSGANSQINTLTVTVTDVNEAPTAIHIDNATVDELAPEGTVIGKLSATDADAADQDPGDFTYTLIDDAGGLVKLVGDELQVNAPIDFETNPGGLIVQIQVQDSAGNTYGQSIQIAVNDLDEVTAPDGYVAGATIFADENGNYAHDTGEAFTESDEFGNFNFVSGGNPIVLTGGTDIATGKAFTGYMAAHAGATVVSPLTTLVLSLHTEYAGTYASEAVANTAVLNAIGLNGGIGALKNYDQIAATIAGDPNAPAAAKAATRLQEMLAMAIPVLVALGATETQAQQQLLVALGADIESSTALTFSAAQIEGYIETAAAALTFDADDDVAAGAGEVIAAILAKMDALGTTGTELLEDLAAVALVASNAAGELATANAGNIGDIVDDYTGANLDALIAGEAVNVQDVAGINGDNVLTGTAGADFLDGGAGDDILNGGDGNDTLIGGDGNDTLNGGSGRDLLIGGDGNDIIDGGLLLSQHDNASSGDIDRVDYSGANGSVSINFGTGTAQGITATNIGNDTIKNVEGVNGSAFDDVLVGGGNFFLEAFRGGKGDDIISGNGGLDRAEYDDATGGISVLLAAGIVEGIDGDNGIGKDTLTSVEDIFGSKYDDTFNATGFTASTAALPSANSGDFAGTFNNFHGGGGNDTIIGNGDTRIDYLHATKGVTVDLTKGVVDASDAGHGIDTFSGVNRVRGSMFDDVLLGGQQAYGAPGKAETFMGMAGNDWIDGGSGFDYAQYQVAAFVLDGIVASAANTAQSDYYGNTYGIIVNMADGKVYGDARSFGTDTLREVEGVIGSSLDDLYDATGHGADSLNALSRGIVIDEFEGGAGNDIIIGSGVTRVSYRNATSGVVVDLGTNNDGSGTVTGDASVGTDILVGGVGSIRGSDFADTLIGWDQVTGLQTFDGQGGDDIIDGGGGFDRVTYNQDNEVTSGITITITADGNVAHSKMSTGLTAVVSGNALEVGNDTLSNIEWYTGTNFDDTITVIGLNAPTNFGTIELEGAGGNDTLNGLIAQGTITRIAYIGATDGVTVAFSGVGSGTAIGNISVGTDTFTNIRDVRGGLYDDIITGGYEVNVNGLMNNIFQGGAGGNDIIEGGADNGAGFAMDQLWGGDADDTNGTESYDGVSAAGFDDFDFVSYANAGSAVTVSLAINTVQNTGGGGNDEIHNFEGIIGSAFNDHLTGSDGFVEVFIGNGGDDVIDGGDGIDIAGYAQGSAGISVNLAAGAVTDLGGNNGNDTLLSVEGIFGTAHADAYNATGFGASSANAGSKGTFNLFRGGGGNDTITGNGNTRIDYSDGLAGITVNLGAATVNATAAGLGIDTLNGGINQVRGTDFADTLIGGTAFNGAGQFEAYIGGGGDDAINGGAGFDRAQYHLDGNISHGLDIRLAAGIVTGDAELTGTDTLSSVEGITGSILGDLYDARGFGGDSTNAGSLGTFNEFEGHAGSDVIYGNGNTRIAFYHAQEGVAVDLLAGTVIGGYSVGSDAIKGGVNAVRGSDFDDIISGDNGANVLEGQDGNDRIEGRGGSDKLTGGEGDDTFVFGAGFGNDVIIDFVAGAGTDDVIEFDSGLFADFGAVQSAMTQVGDDVVISAGGDLLTIRGVTLASLHQDDFTFV